MRYIWVFILGLGLGLGLGAFFRDELYSIAYSVKPAVQQTAPVLDMGSN